MPEENRGPWSKKFENRCRIVSKLLVYELPLDFFPIFLMSKSMSRFKVEIQILSLDPSPVASKYGLRPGFGS